MRTLEGGKNTNVAVFMSCLQKVHPLRYCRLALTHTNTHTHELNNIITKGETQRIGGACAVNLYNIDITVITALKEAFCKSQISIDMTPLSLVER